MPRTLKVVDVKYDEKSNENNEEPTNITTTPISNDTEIELYEAIKEENKQLDNETISNEITTTKDTHETESETNSKQRIHNLVECPDCKKMILEKTLKYSHKQKCSARKVSPPPPPPSPPSPIIIKQTKQKK